MGFPRDIIKKILEYSGCPTSGLMNDFAVEPVARAHATADTCELSILMPCLNEAATLAACIRKAQAFLLNHGIQGEILVADNGSTDDSRTIARTLGARVIEVKQRGYGSALQGGISAAQGRYVIMGDADDSYDFNNLMPFLVRLRSGSDLVMGNRFKGEIRPGAMPLLHRYLGNPVLSALGQLFFKVPAGDFHCGLRGFRTEAIRALNLSTPGMEFASEMVVKASLFGLRISEVPTTLSPDGRDRPPHLATWRDGWRHLRFLLMCSPRWLFLYPGIALSILGAFGMAILIGGPVSWHGVTFDIHTLLFSATAIPLGLQVAFFAIFAKASAISRGWMPQDTRLLRFLAFLTLERGILLGFLFCIAGVLGSLHAFSIWEGTGFGPLMPSRVMRIAIPSLMFLTIGVQVLFSSFYLSILEFDRE